jgi:hypothetical protein
MNTKLFERVEAILKEEQFTHITKYLSTHSATLSADKGAERLVLHVTDRDEMPRQAAANQDVPPLRKFGSARRYPDFVPSWQSRAGSGLGKAAHCANLGAGD